MTFLRRTALTLTTLACLCGGADAVKLGITPIFLDINPARGLTTTTTLANQDTEPVEIVAEVVRWTQRDGQDVLEPTKDALVNPPRFTIQPGRTQVVRVGLRARSSEPEVTYRLKLTTVPKAPTGKAAEGKTSTVLMTSYAFSLPLFVTNPGAQANIASSVERTADGLNLVFKNTGTSYAAYRGVKLVLNEGPMSISGVYVLAGSTMRIPLPKRDYPQKITIQYSDASQQEEE